MDEHLAMPVPARIEHVYRTDEECREYLVGPYLDHLLESYDRVGAQQQRTVRLTLVLTVVSVLLTEAAIEKLALAGVELRDLGVPTRILPAVVAFLVSEAIVARIGARTVWSAVQKIMELSREQLWRRDLEMLIAPMDRESVATLLARSTASRRASMAISALQVAYTVAAMVGPLAFVAYSYWRMFTLYGFGDPLTWCSLLVSIAAVVAMVVSVTQYETLVGGRARRSAVQRPAEPQVLRGVEGEQLGPDVGRDPGPGGP